MPSRAAAHLRKCLVTGEERPKDQLLRFVIAPDHSVVPDLAHNLPGRGLWLTPTAEALQTAVRKNLFAKAAKQPAKPAADLLEVTCARLRARCLNFLGLAKSAGIATLGQMQVEMAVKAGDLALLLIADDAGRDIEKLGSRVATLVIDRRLSRNELGAALGHDQLVYVGLAPHALTEKIRDTLALLSHLTPLATETDT